MRKVFFSIFLIAISIHSLTFAQKKLGLQDCLKLAFEKSHLLRASEISQKAAEAALSASQAQRLPAITLSSLYTRIGKITSFTIPMGGTVRKLQFGTPNRMNLDVKLQLPLFTWGKVSSAIELSRVGKSLAEVKTRQQKIALTAQVLQGYFSVLLNQEVIKLNQSNVERARHHYEVSKKKFDAGLVPQLQMMQAEVQLKTAQTQLQDSQANLNKSLIYLSKLTGVDEKEIMLKDSIQYKPVQFNENEIIEKALTRRSDLKALQLQLQMKQSQISLASSSNKPNLFFFTGYNVTNGFDPMEPDKFVDNYNAGIQLTFPIFDGFATNRKVEQARLDYEALEEQEKEIREMAELQIRQAIIALHQAEMKIAAQEENIRISRETLKTAEIQYRDGLVSSLDVLDAQQMLNQAELLHAQAIFNHIMAKLAICQAIEDYSWFEFALE